VVLGVDRPDVETRLGIMQRFCAQRNLELGAELLHELAAVLPADARLLGGAMNRLHAAATAYGTAPTLAQARELLADLVYSNAKAVRLEEIATVVCDEFGLSVEDLQSDCRAKGVSHPRMLAMFLARRHTRAPLSEIGRYFGRRSHTTVLSAETTVEDWLSLGNNVGGSRSKLSVAEALRRLESRLRVG
jgi:chromosomal replication initiator protein